jgi:hypothetical protein
VRKVESNVFYSSSLPEIWVRVNPEIEYIGCAHETINTQAQDGGKYLTVGRDSYFFAKKGSDNTLVQGVIIILSEVNMRGGYFLPDMLSHISNKLISDVINVNTQNYQRAVTVGAAYIIKYEQDFLMDKGLIVANCNMSEIFARRLGNNNQNIINILYFESIEKASPGYKCFEWKTPLTSKQEDLLDEFLKRRKDNVDILNTAPQKQE